MSTRRTLGPWGAVFGSFLAAGAVLALTSCFPDDWDHKWGGKKGGGPPPPPASPLQVTGCTWGSAAWVPPGAAKDKPVIRLTFSEPVNLGTLKVPQTVRIIMSSAACAPPGSALLPAGTFYPSPDHKSVVLVSALKEPAVLTILGGNPVKNPGGADVGFQVILLGTDDKGSGVIKDATGHALDGDFNGKGGGNYTFGLIHKLTW